MIKQSFESHLFYFLCHSMCIFMLSICKPIHRAKDPIKLCTTSTILWQSVCLNEKTKGRPGSNRGQFILLTFNKKKAIPEPTKRDSRHYGISARMVGPVRTCTLWQYEWLMRHKVWSAYFLTLTYPVYELYLTFVHAKQWFLYLCTESKPWTINKAYVLTLKTMTVQLFRQHTCKVV